MKWRKWNRWIHRELGYLFFGMSIIYGISGIALNHGVARHWNPGIITRSESYDYNRSITKTDVTRAVIEEILEITGEENSFKQYYFPTSDYLMIYLKGGHINVHMPSGEISLIRVRNRPVFNEVNYLHYNKPKKLWTWFSDLFALGLVLMAISGLLLVKGKKGITGRGGLTTLIGIFIPLIFLAIYLWF